MTYNRELTALFIAAFRFDVDLILSDINKTIRKKYIIFRMTTASLDSK